MENNNISDMDQYKDLYISLLQEDGQKESEEEFKKEQFEETQERFEKYMRSNQEMFDYLSENFDGHPSFLNLIHYIIMQVVNEYPRFSAIDYADYFTSLFSHQDKAWFTRDLHQYLSRKLKFKFLGKKYGSKDWLNIEEFESIESHDLAEYVSCIIYNRLKSFDQFQTTTGLNNYDSLARDAMDFYPIAFNRFALNKTFAFKGHVEHIYKRKSHRGYHFAYIFIRDNSGKVFKAVVRTGMFFKLLNGLNKIRDNNCDVVIYGKVVKDKYEEDEIILNANSFVLSISGNIHKYPS